MHIVLAVSRHAGVLPRDLQTDHIRAYLNGRPYRPWTRRTYLQHLSAWSSWIGRPEMTSTIRRPPQPHMQPDPLPEGELGRLMRAAAPDVRIYAWVVLGAYCGLRAHEVAKLSANDLRGTELRVLGKGSRTDQLPMPPVVVDALEPWSTSRGRLWPHTDPQEVSHTIAQLAAGIGITMRFHQLRHRYGTAVYRTTHDLLLTQRLMRHSSPEATAGYAALGDHDGRLAVDKLPGADPGDPTELPPEGVNGR